MALNPWANLLTFHYYTKNLGFIKVAINWPTQYSSPANGPTLKKDRYYMRSSYKRKGPTVHFFRTDSSYLGMLF